MRVTYARLYNLGNYENERFEVSIEVEPGESYDDALTRARGMVEGHAQRLQQQRIEERRIRDAEEIPF